MLVPSLRGEGSNVHLVHVAADLMRAQGRRLTAWQPEVIVHQIR